MIVAQDCLNSIMTTHDLVTIQKYGTPQEAHLARSVLDAAGIEACVTDESTATWMWYVGTALGGARVQVAEHDAERARQVLQDAKTPSAENAQTDWHCPQCGADVDAGFDVCWSCESLRGANHQDGEHAIRAQNAPSSSTTLNNDDVDAPAEQPGDADAARACRAALFGVFFPPLMLYAIYLVLKTVNQDLSSHGMRQFCGALGISLLFVTFIATMIVNWR
jgi:hypothetical protein